MHLNFPSAIHQYALGAVVINALSWDRPKDTPELSEEYEKKAVESYHNRKAEDIGHIIGFGLNEYTREVLLKVQWASGLTTSIHPRNVLLLY